MTHRLHASLTDVNFTLSAWKSIDAEILAANGLCARLLRASSDRDYVPSEVVLARMWTLAEDLRRLGARPDLDAAGYGTYVRAAAQRLHAAVLDLLVES